MFDAVSRLRRHLQHMINNKTSAEDAIGVLRLLRLILEQDKSQAAYPTLWLYCNWALHTEIERQDLGWQVLEGINNALVQFRDDVDGLLGAINHALRLSELRGEMSRLFAAKGIHPMITHSLRNWTQFLGFVLDELKHRPIRFPADAVTKRTGKAGVIFDRMEKHSATVYKDGYIPIALYLSYLSDWDPPGFFFNVELFDLTGGAPTTMAGPLFFTEDATQFAHP